MKFFKFQSPLNQSLKKKNKKNGMAWIFKEKHRTSEDFQFPDKGSKFLS